MPVSRYALHFARILNRTVRLSKTRLLQSGRGRRGLLAAKNAVGGVRARPRASRFTIGPLPRRLCRCGLITKRSEEHTSELQSLMRISYAVFCLKKKTQNKTQHLHYGHQII